MDPKEKKLHSLSDADIKVVRLDRRSFLGQVGVLSAGVATAALIGGCRRSDSCNICDSDVPSDADPFDPPSIADACDFDVCDSD